MQAQTLVALQAQAQNLEVTQVQVVSLRLHRRHHLQRVAAVIARVTVMPLRGMLSETRSRKGVLLRRVGGILPLLEWTWVGRVLPRLEWTRVGGILPQLVWTPVEGILPQLEWTQRDREEGEEREEEILKVFNHLVHLNSSLRFEYD